MDKLVQEGYPVIALGGTVGRSYKDKDRFFQEVFKRYPDMAFHALGVNKTDLILRYPFFSCDSTAWIYSRIKKIVLTAEGQKIRSDMDHEERILRSVKFLKGLENPGVYKRISLKLSCYL